MTKWICHPEDHKDNPLVPVFRRRIKLRQKVKKAVLKLSAHGLYEMRERHGKSLYAGSYELLLSYPDTGI